MNQKEYELIASVIKGRRANTRNLDKLGWSADEVDAGLDVLADFTDFITAELARNYANFDRDKFLTACGVNEKGF